MKHVAWVFVVGLAAGLALHSLTHTVSTAAPAAGERWEYLRISRVTTAAGQSYFFAVDGPATPGTKDSIYQRLGGSVTEGKSIQFHDVVNQAGRQDWEFFTVYRADKTVGDDITEDYWFKRKAKQP